MNVRNAGYAIKTARKKAKLSQQKISDGICSVLSLSRIENGTAGVSPATFHALMTRIGIPFECYPIFKNQEDYDIFCYLKKARFYLNKLQIDEAFDLLEKVENEQWAKNKLYYQEWLFIYGKILICSGNENSSYIYNLFLTAIHQTKPEINLYDFENEFLSTLEIEILIFIAQVSLANKNLHFCHIICNQIYNYLIHYPITSHEIDYLETECNIVYIQLLIEKNLFIPAKKLAYTSYNTILQNNNTDQLLALTFLIGFCEYCIGNRTSALKQFNTIEFTCYALNSHFFVSNCQKYMQQHNIYNYYAFNKFNYQSDLTNIPLKKLEINIFFAPITFDIYNPNVITMGILIHRLRLRQNLSLEMLCNGICSKSTLSKIENGKLQPSIILLETLLQRLGYSEKYLTFWGDIKESEYHELKLNIKKQLLPPTQKQHQLLVNKLFSFIGAENDLYHQYYLYQKSFLINNNLHKITLLKQALHCTIKELNIDTLKNYRFSWIELMILNQLILHSYENESPYVTVQNFRKLLQYYDSLPTDIIFQSETRLISFYLYFELLYKEQHYKTIIDLYNAHFKNFNLNHNLVVYSKILFYYACSEKKITQNQTASNESYYAYWLLDLLKLTSDRDVLANLYPSLLND